MKRTNRNPNHVLKLAAAAGLLGLLGTLHSHAQFTFSSGSTGADGPLDVTTNTTLTLPPNGVFNFTTLTIASNATLKFSPNALNTPVYLLAQGEVMVNGTIDVSGSAGTTTSGGAGGPGGFAGGTPGYGSVPPGDGFGPGAGRAGTRSGALVVGAGAYATGGANSGTNNGLAYGSPLLMPLIGGSGGGAATDGSSGWGGGGAILIASSSRIIVQGTIAATSPGSPLYGSEIGWGSGGAVRLVAPAVGGSGVLNVSGGLNTYYGSMHGGAGRIRIDCMDRRSLPSLACNPVSSLSIGANMVAIPTNPPMLDIVQVGANTIAPGTGSPVFFVLPQGASTNQNVTVQARNFGMPVNIRVVLTPDNGSSSAYDTNLDNTISPASVTVPVVVPLNVQVKVNVWTR